MPQSVFVDGIAEISVIGGVVRIDFFSVVPSREGAAKSSDGSNLTRVPAMTVAMPLPGFVSSLQALDDTRNKMIAEGVIKTRSEQPAEVEARIKSKNFS